MQINDFNIQQFLDLTGYNEIRKDRRKSKEVNSQEFFTPYSIVKRMCDKVSDEDWADPKKTFLEPSAGSGQFVIDEMKERVHKMLSQICPDTYNKASATRIMNKNFVCHDFFTWDFEEWRPMTEEEIKKAKKKK